MVAVCEVAIKKILTRADPSNSENDPFVSAGYLEEFQMKKVSLGTGHLRRPVEPEWLSRVRITSFPESSTNPGGKGR